MSYHSPYDIAHAPIDAGTQMAQLRHVLRLVEDLAGRSASAGSADAALDENATISTAYWDALPIVRRRFDALALETACWSTAAVEALLAAGDARSPAAAGRLADELERALQELRRLLRS